MTSGFGVDPTEDVNGIPISGTSSADIRAIFGSLYSPGIISGCTVTTSPSAMQYSVSAGVAAIRTATGETVLVPVPATTVLTTVAPASGTRVDTLYVQQRYPDIEGDSEVVVKVTQAGPTGVPQRALALKNYMVSAGNTVTNQAAWQGSINYSIPYGAGLGVLKQHRNTFNGTFTTMTTITTQTVYLPTDRLVKISLESSLSAYKATKYDNADYCEVAFDFYRNGSRIWRWNTPGLSQAWATFYWQGFLNLTAGTHTFMYKRGRSALPGTPYHHYAVGLYPGSLLTIEDAGPIV